MFLDRFNGFAAVGRDGDAVSPFLKQSRRQPLVHGIVFRKQHTEAGIGIARIRQGIPRE